MQTKVALPFQFCKYRVTLTSKSAFFLSVLVAHSPARWWPVTDTQEEDGSSHLKILYPQELARSRGRSRSIHRSFEFLPSNRKRTHLPFGPFIMYRAFVRHRADLRKTLVERFKLWQITCAFSCAETHTGCQEMHTTGFGAGVSKAANPCEPPTWVQQTGSRSPSSSRSGAIAFVLFEHTFSFV